MPYPLHARGAVAPLRGLSEAEMTDVVVLHWTTIVEAGNSEDLEIPHSSEPIACRLSSVSAGAADLAAARGIEAQFLLALPIGTTARPGMTATVERATEDEEWTREVRLTGVDLPGGVHVTCTAVDVGLNR